MVVNLMRVVLVSSDDNVARHSPGDTAWISWKRRERPNPPKLGLIGAIMNIVIQVGSDFTVKHSSFKPIDTSLQPLILCNYLVTLE